MQEHYNNGPEGMPRVKRMTDLTLNCIIRNSLFSIFDSFEGEDRERLYSLLHDTAEEVLARVPAWPAAQPAEPAQGVGLTDERAWEIAVHTLGTQVVGWDKKECVVLETMDDAGEFARAILARQTAPTAAAAIRKEVAKWENGLADADTALRAIERLLDAPTVDSAPQGEAPCPCPNLNIVNHSDGSASCIGKCPAAPQQPAAERTKLREMRNEEGEVGWYFDCDGHYIDVERDKDGNVSIYFKDRSDGKEGWFDQAERAAVPEGWKIKTHGEDWICYERPDGTSASLSPGWSKGSHSETLHMLMSALAAAPSPQEGKAARELAERLQGMGVTKFSAFPGSDPSLTPDQVAAEVSRSLDQLEGKAVEGGQDTGALIDAAEQYATAYDGDDRECIKTDVMNAFYAGAEYGAAQQTSAQVDAQEGGAA